MLISDGFKNSVKESAKYLANVLCEALFPRVCLGCRNIFHLSYDYDDIRRNPDKASSSIIEFDDVMAPFLCSACSPGYTKVKSPICTCCGMMLKKRDEDDHLCEDCQTYPKFFRKARAYGINDQMMLEAIHCLKYRQMPYLAKPLGKLLFFTFLQHWTPEDIDVIVPMPLHIKRFRKRGYNQAYLFIRNWHKTGYEFHMDIAGIRIDRDVLDKYRQTKTQVGMNREERENNIKDTFRVTDPARIQNKRILLVDDVYTTGATANECARVLRENGATLVDVLVLAQTVKLI